MVKAFPLFSLRKWYMDCIDKMGNLFIGYSASLHWKKIEINYASTLTCNQQDEIVTASSLRNQSHPTLEGETLQWNHDKLKTVGNWTIVDPPVSQNILNEKSGSLIWNCNQPKAIAEVKSNNMSFKDAIGYTEMIEMTILPWLLPISKLWWGRFLSQNNTLIWIVWEGESNFHFVYFNGNEIADAAVTDNEVVLNDQGMTLTFSETVVLRDGSLASTLFSHISTLSKMVPTGFLNSHECKWRSKGNLTKNGKVIDTGWVIHEVVTWGK
tara:strand:- start:1919 stop:2722 length:804 start_codon:yes stop_codon:yes gene_type:complete